MDQSKEPNADQRGMAAALFGMFNALMIEGFSEAQALSIVGALIVGRKND